VSLVGLYGEFAAVYARGPYPEYSKTIARLLPGVLRKFAFSPRDLLDLACGEGTFAVAMAKCGIHVTGIDQSPDMLRLAKQRARRERIGARFLHMDMRSLPFVDEFDMVTCWYDSLNYLLKSDYLKKTFSGVFRALRSGGLFIFDMNTIYALSVFWQQYPCRLQQDTDDIFEVHRPHYDARRRTATMDITAFVKNGPLWKRLDERHRERGYAITEIRRVLRESGLKELACWRSIRKMTPPKRDTGRVWFVAQRT
jgi:SAM-dependent methyltransferase